MTLIREGYDFVCNRLPPPYHRTYPIGLDVEVCSLPALEKAWNESDEAQHREHVMPYLYEGVKFSQVSPVLEEGWSKRGFKIAMIHHPVDYGSYRWTVDTAEDLEFTRQIFGRFNERDDFSWIEVLELVQAEPKLMEINAGIQHKNLKDIDPRAQGG
jgi:spore coat polysaccharide biosynthesis protein SpsF